MKVFCPNCGHAHEATTPGAKLMCTACGGAFDAPGGSASASPVPPPSGWNPPPTTSPGSWNPPPQPAAPSWQPSGQPVPGTPTSFGAPLKTNPLAIISLVAGIVCCIPFASIGALVTGIIAIKQIDERPTEYTGKGLAIAGIVLGGLSLFGNVLAVASGLLNR